MGVAAWAAETDCSTQAGAAVTAGPVNAAAHFSTGPGFITVTLSNNLADPRSAGQLLNGMSFTVSEGEAAGSLGPNSANLRRVVKGGTFTDLGSSATGWALGENVSGGLLLCVLCTDLGAAGPSHLLIGPPSGVTGLYSNANASLAGSRSHNPFDSGLATFLLNVPGVTQDSTVTAATFFFSTAEGVSAAGTCSGNIIPQ